MKLKRFKAFYKEKVDSDLDFVKKVLKNDENSDEKDEKIFEYNPCSILSHFVNRIDEVSTKIYKQEMKKHELSDGFLSFSSDLDLKEESIDYTFNCSLTSISEKDSKKKDNMGCLLYTSPSPRDS